MKLFTITLIGMAFLSILLAACTRTGTLATVTTAPIDTGNVVHMDSSQFLRSSITIKKGSLLTLVDDVAVPHVIFNGSWVNHVAQTKVENGAPTVNLQFVGNDTQNIGPFTTTGTYKLYCSVHEDMDLTVIVQ